MMRKFNQNLAAPDSSNLFDRVVTILERARTDSVRAVNNNMVIAYWLIGREIVLEIQGGKERAEYGKQLIEQLSQQLTQKYGRGFSTTNLRYFRTFTPFMRIVIRRFATSQVANWTPIKNATSKVAFWMIWHRRLRRQRRPWVFRRTLAGLITGL